MARFVATVFTTPAARVELTEEELDYIVSVIGARSDQEEREAGFEPDMTFKVYRALVDAQEALSDDNDGER